MGAVRRSILAAVALGGALGAVLRYLLGEWFPVAAGAFPWTTFGINVSGSLLLALLQPRVRGELGRAFVGPGLLGGFTTLSAYSEDARRLADLGSTGLAAAYVAGTLACCLAGVAMARRLS